MLPPSSRDGEIFDRACKALLRRAAREGAAFDEPSKQLSYWDVRRQQLVLRNERSTVARCKVTSAGRLRFVSRVEASEAAPDDAGLWRAMGQIEARTGLPFEQWIDRVTSNPVCALVKQEHADCFVIYLVDITGRVLVEVPVKREFYDAIHAAVTARGVALHQFIVEAVETYCAQVSGGGAR